MLARTAFSTKPSNGPAQLHQARPLALEHLPDRPFLELRVFGSLGVGDALDLPARRSTRRDFFTRGLGRNSWSRRSPTWFSTCPFSQPEAGVQATWLNQMVRAHLQKAAVVLARLATKIASTAVFMLS